MKIPQKKAVSPIIATLLLIAIAVAAGIIVYVFVGSLSGSLTKSGGSQVSENLSLDAYTSAVGSNCSVLMTVRNVGGGAVTIANVYLDGSLVAQKNTFSLSVPVQGTIGLLLAQTSGTASLKYAEFGNIPALTSGTSHQIRVVTIDGGTFTFNFIAGSSG